MKLRRDKDIIPEYIECTKGIIMMGTYQMVRYSLTLKPDIVEVYRVTRKETTLETTFKTLEEYLNWYSGLQSEYGHRITRKKLHHVKYEDNQFKYFESPKSPRCGLSISDGLIIVPQSITVCHRSAAQLTITLEVSSKEITVTHSKGSLQFNNEQDYSKWYKDLITYGKPLTKKGIRYYRYTQETGFQRVTNEP